MLSLITLLTLASLYISTGQDLTARVADGTASAEEVFELGCAHAFAMGVPEDREKGLKLLREAAALGSVEV